MAATAKRIRERDMRPRYFFFATFFAAGFLAAVFFAGAFLAAVLRTALANVILH
jgi:hypothetical protein